MTDHASDEAPPARPSGAAQGGRGGPETELLEDGQEEVLSRSEVELGRIEHAVEAGGSAAPRGAGRGGGHESPDA